MTTTSTAPFNLTAHGLTVAEIHRNLPPSALYEHAIRYEKDASIAQNGALVAYSGATARKLANLFNDNFKNYASGVSEEVRAAAPVPQRGSRRKESAQ